MTVSVTNTAGDYTLLNTAPNPSVTFGSAGAADDITLARIITTDPATTITPDAVSGEPAWNLLQTWATTDSRRTSVYWAHHHSSGRPTGNGFSGLGGATDYASWLYVDVSGVDTTLTVPVVASTFTDSHDGSSPYGVALASMTAPRNDTLLLCGWSIYNAGASITFVGPSPSMTTQYSNNQGGIFPTLVASTTVARGASPVETWNTTVPSRPAAGWAVLIPGPNRAPTAGAPTTPASGAVMTTTSTIAWAAGTDPDGDPLVYDVEFTRDNGATWARLLTGTSSLSSSFNFASVANSTACKLRVRTSDGVLTSAWVVGPTFTINHNVPPTPATGLSPDGAVTLDRASSNTGTWTYNDPDVGDNQSRADVRWRTTGAWTTVTHAAAKSRTYTWAANALAAGDYEWQVLTYDSFGVAATGWSASAFFTMGNIPAGPSSLVPTNGSTVPTTVGTLAWTVTAQDSYQVRKLADALGSPDTGTVLYDSGEVVSPSARSHPLTFPTNNEYEHLQVRVKSAGLWSPWSSVRVLVAYTPPATPTVAFVEDPVTASIAVLVSNPVPTGTQPAVTSWDLRRRVLGDTSEGIRVAVELIGPWTFWTPASGISYEFQAVAHGANDVDSASVWTA